MPLKMRSNIIWQSVSELVQCSGKREKENVNLISIAKSMRLETKLGKSIDSSLAREQKTKI